MSETDGKTGPCPLQAADKPATTLMADAAPSVQAERFCCAFLPVSAPSRLSTNLIIYMTKVMGEDNGFAAIQVRFIALKRCCAWRMGPAARPAADRRSTLSAASHSRCSAAWSPGKDGLGRQPR